MRFTPPKVLFILKKRFQYTDGYPDVKSSGLLNSARFVVQMLNEDTDNVKLVEVNDNNDIDREVTKFNPDIVIIEALWVVPEKFDVLKHLHPKVKWVVRLHSEIPFLANEGNAMGWIRSYVARGVFISFNSKQTMDELVESYGHIPGHSNWALFMPNYYPVAHTHVPYKLDKKDTIDVGCFGAVRPMKNQLIQAIAAVKFARRHNLKLRFHINATRIDNATVLPVLKNLRDFFHTLNDTRFKLVEHEWYQHDQFLEVVRQMDIGLQVSMTETFNIVAANFISENVPLVASREIDWVPDWFTARETDSDAIVHAMERALEFKVKFDWTDFPRLKLRDAVEHARHLWNEALWYLADIPTGPLPIRRPRNK